jgi:WD40 repeat protein
VAASETNGTIHIYMLPSGQEVSRLTVRPRLIGMAYDPEGRRLAVSFEENPSVVVLDVETKATCATLNEGGGVQCLAWSPDGQVLAPVYELFQVCFVVS